MTIAGAERQEALLHMVASGAFRDDVALARWSVSDEAVPHLRRWLEDGCRPHAVHVDDIDLDAADREIVEQDALAVHIQTTFSPRHDEQTIIDMYELGWFGQSPAFWRWVGTEPAQPYVVA